MENLELIQRVKENDDFAYEQLLKKYHRMIHSIINEFNLDYGDYKVNREDLYQEACIALFDACKTYRVKEDVLFSTFVYTVIKRRVCRYYKKYRRAYLSEKVSIDNYQIVDHHKEMSSLYIHDDPLKYHYKQSINDMLNKKCNRLNQLDRNIIMLRMENYSYKEIAEKLNINTKKVDNRLSRLRNRYLKNE